VAGRSTKSLDLTKMSSQQQQLRNLARVERYRTLRNWALGLGLVAFVMGLIAAGFGGGNPESATSAYSAFALAGLLRWAAIPLVSASFALIIVAVLLHGLSRRGHGEV
jgi:lipopolysaccharide export LptBFGC system permease protein LptF